jgi:hypothetical protein
MPTVMVRRLIRFFEPEHRRLAELAGRNPSDRMR